MESIDNMENMTIALLGTSSLGGVLAYLFGGFDALLDALVLFMILDVLLGILVAVWKHRSSKTESGRFSSETMYYGVTRKFLVFIVLIVAVALDRLLGTYIIVGDSETTLLRSTVCIFYIAIEASSILENVALLGFPLPKKLLDVLEVMRRTNE